MALLTSFPIWQRKRRPRFVRCRQRQRQRSASGLSALWSLSFSRSRPYRRHRWRISASLASWHSSSVPSLTRVAWTNSTEACICTPAPSLSQFPASSYTRWQCSTLVSADRSWGTSLRSGSRASSTLLRGCDMHEKFGETSPATTRLDSARAWGPAWDFAPGNYRHRKRTFRSFASTGNEASTAVQTAD
jgi:hypothetical protein